MTDPVLWAGIVLLVGSLGAMASRASRAPAASGALAGGFVISFAAAGSGLMTGRPDLRGIHYTLVAFVCFLLGAELDLTGLARHLRAVATTVLLQGVMVAGLVGVAGMALGLDGRSSLALGVALTATCPASLVAVSSECRSRGDLTQRLLAQSTFSLVAALCVLHVVFLPGFLLGSFLADLLIGGLCGVVCLLPLSRMARRGAIVAAAMAGALLIVLALGRRVAAAEHLALASIVAGFVAANLTPNRDTIRDALRDVSIPCVVIVFALSGQHVTPGEIGPALGAGALLLLARWAGLAGAGTMLRGRRDGLLQAFGQIPVAGLTSVGPIVLLFTGAVPKVEVGYTAPLAAAFLSEAAGMFGTRWALQRSGEGSASMEDPDAWRARMR